MKNQLIILWAGLTFLFLASLCLGSVFISPIEIFDILRFSELGNPAFKTIILNYRVPKALASIFAGSALGISGLLMQTFFRNPLAGPYILGISSGASLGVALVLFVSSLFAVEHFIDSRWVVQVAAALGSGVVFAIIILLARSVGGSFGLLIIGVMVSGLVSSVISILQYFSEAESIKAFLIWQFSSIGTVNWADLTILIPVISLAALMSYFISKPLNALLLGPEYAISVGVNIEKLKIQIVSVTSLLAAAVTAFVGPVAFLGLALPHMARMVSQTSDHRQLTLLLIPMGGITLLASDIIAQLPFSDYLLPLNVVTSLIGAPVVILIILKNRRLSSG